MLLKTDKDSYLPGEIVTITLLNAGNETVDISEMPPWEICQYIFHHFVPVYPCIFLPVVWSLGPGQSRNYTWNQRDGFNGQPVGLGQYVVMDTQGWGLSAYFPIVPAIVVPEDFPTIQEAINNANEGDTIFVRNGTYYENVVVNKTVSLIGEGKDSTILNGTTIEPIMTVEANDVKISDFAFEGWAFQNIVINTTTGVTIVENKIVFNALGIDVENSVNTTIENNTINGFGLDNIGIMLAYSSECSIVNNTITNAVYDGIRLWFSGNSLIHQNLIRDNDYGIFFHEANLNTISENTISESGGSGIYIESSSSNEILHNNFVDNYGQATIYDNSVNTWDNGCEGNYWSDYNGTDSDGDGVGDISYIIASNNLDNYPLINPYWNPADINHDLKIDIKDIYVVGKAYGTSATGPNPADREWNPHCDINEDGAIDMKDYYIVCKNYGKTYS